MPLDSLSVTPERPVRRCCFRETVVRLAQVAASGECRSGSAAAEGIVRLAWVRPNGRRDGIHNPDGGLERTLEGHRAGVLSGCFSPDGARVLSASGDTTLRLWRSADGGLERTLEGHRAGVLSGCFSPDGARVLSASGDNARQAEI